jgi:polysaccharide deacetylase family protein (PEP-CTERM system associated)
MTVDVEDWYMTNGLDIPPERWGLFEDRVVQSTGKVLELLDRHRTKATFFVLGCVAQRHPGLVERIAEGGHEIGTHGGWHRMLTRMTPEEIAGDILESKRVLERISGLPVRLFRAPSWSMNPRTYSVLQMLERAGFLCDSSIQPFRTPLSGLDDAPSRPFHPIVEGERLNLVEFPSMVWEGFGARIPFSGGFYLRAMPYGIVRALMRSVNRSSPGMVYVHPWEFDPSHPRVKASPLIRLAQYYNLTATESKFERLLRDFAFAPLGEILKGRSFPDATLRTADRPSGSP